MKECIGTRSSAQIRSHAQKYLIKLCKKYNIEEDRHNKLFKKSLKMGFINDKMKNYESTNIIIDEFPGLDVVQIEQEILKIFKSGSTIHHRDPLILESLSEEKRKVFATVKETKKPIKNKTKNNISANLARNTPGSISDSNMLNNSQNNENYNNDFFVSMMYRNYLCLFNPERSIKDSEYVIQGDFNSNMTLLNDFLNETIFINDNIMNKIDTNRFEGNLMNLLFNMNTSDNTLERPNIPNSLSSLLQSPYLADIGDLLLSNPLIDKDMNTLVNPGYSKLEQNLENEMIYKQFEKDLINISSQVDSTDIFRNFNNINGGFFMQAEADQNGVLPQNMIANKELMVQLYLNGNLGSFPNDQIEEINLVDNSELLGRYLQLVNKDTIYNMSPALLNNRTLENPPYLDDAVKALTVIGDQKSMITDSEGEI